MKLNVYDAKMQNVVKVYETSSMKLPFGVAEDILALVDGSLFSKDPNVQNQAILALISKSFTEVKNILSILFPDITDEEIKCIDLLELVVLMKEVLAYIMTMVGMFFGKN